MKKKSMFEDKKSFKFVSFLTLVLISAAAIADIILYATLAEPVSFCTILIINLIFILVAVGGYLSDLPFFYFLIGAASIVLFFFTVNFETSFYNVDFIILGGFAVAGGTLSTVLFFAEKIKPNFLKWGPMLSLFLAVALAVGGVSTWGVLTSKDRDSTSFDRELYSVPSIYDASEPAEKGKLETFSYSTKAYATDQRALVKSAFVYLPYGYSTSEKYDVLYLLHGTGGSEASWMADCSANETLVDNLIADGLIKKLIIVMPSFYDESDCLNNLDAFTYSFKYELKNDLVPAVESHYSTYADGVVTATSLTESRDHRAFAGLSRGAVITMRSVLCGALDYFSDFGVFSASRIDEDYYSSTAMSADFSSYKINYFYMTSGVFDFSLSREVEDYRMLTSLDSRLQNGVNASFDVFPTKYHSMASWHLALYNFLNLVYRQ